MLGKTAGKRLTAYISDYVIFDLETTGISSAADEVIEISAVKVKGGRVVEEFSTLVNPGRPIPFATSQVNGITDDMVKNSPCFEQAFAAFLEFVGNEVLVGHNIHNFDMKFLYRDAGRFWNQTLTNDYVDTLQMARVCLPQLRHHKLTDLAQYYGICSEGAHRALCDCRMNQKVFELLGKESAKSKAAQKVCPRCGSDLKRRSGRFGDFWGCAGFPACRYTENI